MSITGFLVVAPSVVRMGETFDLKIKALRPPYLVPWRGFVQSGHTAGGPFNRSHRGIRYLDNVPLDWRGQVSISGPGWAGPTTFDFADVQGNYPGDQRPIATVEGGCFTSPGTQVITVRDRATGVTSLSNPVMVCEDDPGLRLYWGDIHCQTFFSDGLRCPEELYSFARHEAFLDAFAVSDHTDWITDAQWDYFTAVANAANEPGDFVTLVGQEWTSKEYGHRNIYYRGDGGPILRTKGPGRSNLEDVYRTAREHNALVIPHHPANVEMGVDWSLGYAPVVERLCEIYSIWGNSERSREAGNPRPIRVSGGEMPGQHVIDALRLGRRYGLIGGGDIHDGRPGDDLHWLQREPTFYPELWRQGTMGIWAPCLTREAVFDALWERRVYATTNVRMVVQFSVAGAIMGSDIQHDGPREVRVRAESETPLRQVDIVRNGEDWHTSAVGGLCAAVVLEDDDSQPAWYYARVTRTDGEMAWSSPVWVNYPDPSG